MTGQELIDYIEEAGLYDNHFFINVDGKISPIQDFFETHSGDIILSQEGRCVDDYTVTEENLKAYFSEWFDIIPESDAKQLWEDGYKRFLVLASDGTDRYADNFGTWKEIENCFPDALFGLER